MRGVWRAALVSGLALAGAALAAPSADDLPELRARGTLRVLAVLSPQEAYFFNPLPQGPPGFDHEILDGFARLQDLKLELVPAPSWDELIPWLLAGKGDVIAGGFTNTAERREQVQFTPESFPTRTVVITRRPHRVVENVEQLKQEKVGVIAGTAFVGQLAEAGVPPERIDSSIATGAFPEALSSGQVTAVVDGVEAALKARERDPDLQLGLFLGPPESLAYAVRKQDAMLHRELSDYVANVRRTPTWSRLAIEYFGEAAPEILRRARSR